MLGSTGPSVWRVDDLVRALKRSPKIEATSREAPKGPPRRSGKQGADPFQRPLERRIKPIPNRKQIAAPEPVLPGAPP